MRKINPIRTNKTAAADDRNVKALRELFEDLGFQIDTDPAGDWIISGNDPAGDREVLGVDSAQKVAAIAQELSEYLQIDRDLVSTR